MNKLKHFKILLFIVLFGVQGTYAQILDDSSKNVYGEHSTQYFTENDVLYNYQFKNIDTNFNLIHRYEKLQERTILGQNLGYEGSAFQNITLSPTQSIGYQNGYHAYDKYASNSSLIKYYNSKSPYTKLDYLQGGTGENRLNFTFSRNITPGLNFGFDIQRFTTTKQMGRKSQRQRALENWDFVFFTSYISKNNRYKLLLNAHKFSHISMETGGLLISLDQVDTVNAKDNALLPVVLSDSARSIDDRVSYRLYHQLGLNKSSSIALYHTISYNKFYNGYTDNLIQKNTKKVPYLYPAFLLGDTNRTSYRAKNTFFTNTVGVKLSTKYLYLGAYANSRNYTYQEITMVDSLSNKSNFKDLIAGANANILLNKNYFLEGRIEKLINLNIENQALTNFKNYNDFLINLNLKAQNFIVSYNLAQVSPSFQQIKYSGNNYIFNNNLKAILNSTLNFAYNFKFKNQRIGVNLVNTNTSNYTYYTSSNLSNENHTLNTTVLQSDVSTLVGSLNADLNIAKKVYFILDASYLIQKDGYIQLPTKWANTCVFYQKSYKNKIKARFGFDFGYRDAYFANGYNPVLQQFYYQNEYKTPSYILADVFTNIKVGKAAVWVKVGNVAQNLIQDVYFTTPTYSSVKRALHFGFQWSFYD